MYYYIPEWDDLVYDKYDYWNDRPLPNAKKVYAHEIFPKPNYDGILVSRAKLEDNKTKLERIFRQGIHSFLRFKGPIFGDCGAWGYVKEKKPPYKTEDILEYYEKIGVNYGVSIDHLCVVKSEKEKYYRHKLTIKNAERFYQLYQEKEYSFHPVGACQGFNVQTYRESVKEVLDIGYDYIALGGLARATTSQIIKVLKGIQDLIKKRNVQIHIFGVARLEAIRIFKELGVTSFDSASPLRSAWLSSEKNYRTMDWEGYSSIRLPFLTRTKKHLEKAKKLNISVEELAEIERSIYQMLRLYEFKKSRSPEEIVEAFQMLNNLMDLGRDRSEDYIRTLKDKPWEKCDCVICKEMGMDVIIFRGNERNRRRGFHNTYVFYKLFKQLLKEEKFQLPTRRDNKIKKMNQLDQKENLTLDRFFESKDA